MFLKNANIEDFEVFYKLKCEKENIYWTNYINAPVKDKLFNWYKSELSKKDRYFLLAENLEGEVVGYGYIDIKDGETFEISYGISSNFTGLGLGRELVKSLEEKCYELFKEVNEIVAWILEDNIKSRKCLERNLWIETEELKEIYFEPEKQVKKMIKYIKR